MADYRIGTSGWSYPNWAGPFYPTDLKRNEWLGHYAQVFSTVELNASFYRLPMANMLKGWSRRTPDDFLFAIKAWRVITHNHRLADCADYVKAFFERIEPLGEKIGPVLFQLPPKFRADLERLDNFLQLLPQGRRAAFEFRDDSWHQDAVYDLLRRHNCAFVPFELAGQTAPRAVTADFVYVRLHGREAKYHGRYSETALQDWAAWLKEQLAEGRDVYLYFDNTDEEDDAVRDALTLNTMLAE